MFMQQKSAEISRFLAKNRLSQGELAKRAGVSQSTVCRCLNEEPHRHGAARAKLLAYVEEQGQVSKMPRSSDDLAGIMEVVAKVWDGTHSHAQLIVDVVSALSGVKQRSER